MFIHSTKETILCFNKYKHMNRLGKSGLEKLFYKDNALPLFFVKSNLTDRKKYQLK